MIKLRKKMKLKLKKWKNGWIEREKKDFVKPGKLFQEF
jgi:hypothetical protein